MCGYGDLKPIEGKILENIYESKNSIYLTEGNDIISEVKKIVINESNTNSIYVGIINDKVVERIKKDINIDLSGYRIDLLSSGIKHWYKRHVLNEANMFSMKIEDILDYINLICDYDTISLIEKESNRKITFKK